MARKSRQEMSGVFDYFSKKKKKGEEQKSLWEMIVPPIPSSTPPSEIPKEKTVISFFKPKSNLPSKAEPKKSFLPSVDFLIPKEKKQKPISILPEVTLPKAEKESKPLEEGFKEVFKSTPAPKTQRYVFLNPSRPPEGVPIRPYGLPAPSTAPVMEWVLPTPSQLATHFRKTMNLPAIWDEIRRVRSLPDFKKDQLIYSWQGIPMMIPVDPVVYQEEYTDYANFYGIPWDVMAMYLNVPADKQKVAEEALQNNVISPLNAMVPEAFDLLKPPDIPGFFNVTFTEPGGEYWLFYIEPKLEGLVPPGGFGGA